MNYILNLILSLFVIECENLKFEDIRSEENLQIETELNIMSYIFDLITLTNQPTMLNTIESNGFLNIDNNTNQDNFENTPIINQNSYYYQPAYNIFSIYYIIPGYYVMPNNCIVPGYCYIPNYCIIPGYYIISGY
ncbi:hypothetical protein NAPIS_ORF01910 [Vairimorpha apis BRL 01]|uniref:Uncharacterized protein n=1 Tax=Vairimorpha apis BRL 01 TaxID=1037528 RepID=T0MBH0_9MICR|nr:hypothetical protein NAPIS_ORF01910 [Vairimorpha apis BRL 01]